MKTFPAKRLVAVIGFLSAGVLVQSGSAQMYETWTPQPTYPQSTYTWNPRQPGQFIQGGQQMGMPQLGGQQFQGSGVYYQYPQTTYYRYPRGARFMAPQSTPYYYYYPQANIYPPACCCPPVSEAIPGAANVVVNRPEGEASVLNGGEDYRGGEEKSATGSETTGQTAQGWDFSALPLSGEFDAMVHQVAGDVDWMLTAHGDKFSRETQALLNGAREQLDLSCEICEQDPDLFTGQVAEHEHVHDVMGQIRQFHDLVNKAMEQPDMRQMDQSFAPARADRNKAGQVFGSLDEASRNKMFGFMALQVLQQRAKELASYADAVNAGTFRPVGDRSSGKLAKGDMAPDFSLQTVDGKTISLEDYKGKTLVLVFNRGHFCPYCMNQVSQLSEIADELKEHNAEVVCVFRELQPGNTAAQGIEGLRAFAEQNNPPCVMAVDFGSHVTSQYSPDGHYSTYIIDGDSKIDAVLQGVKYIRPSAEAMLAAVTGEDPHEHEGH